MYNMVSIKLMTLAASRLSEQPLANTANIGIQSLFSMTGSDTGGSGCLKNVFCYKIHQVTN